MRFRPVLYFLFFVSSVYLVSTTGSGCAQIGAPTGGSKDTIAPKLIKANPGERTLNFTGNKITFTFNEYIEVQDVQNNVLVSPLTKNNPQIDYKLNTVTVKFKDSLLPNTTYSVNFGNSIKDLNEGNPFSYFTYIFSTGNTIDSLSLQGKIILAETGKPDSTIAVLLYRNTADTAIQKLRPDYIARLKGDGSFIFNNLPSGNFNLFALKDGDGSKTYNSKKEIFGFSDKLIPVNTSTTPVTLFAYAQEKEKPAATVSTTTEKKLKYTTAITNNRQDLLTSLDISFNKPLKNFEPAQFSLTDTNYKSVPALLLTIDSTRKIISLKTKWTEDFNYILVINKDGVTDSADAHLAKTDTLAFFTKKESDYGNITLRFSNLELTKKPVVQFVQGDEVKQSFPLTSKEWNSKLFAPGEYELRILYDENGNGKWDAGNYEKKKQPEKVIAIGQKISIRPNFDNEKEITL